MESWTQEQENREWESTQSRIDAKLQLDAFQRQYDQISQSHLDLITKGRSLAVETEESDSLMFGRGPTDSAHPATVKVEGVVSLMSQAHDKMEGVVNPRLQRLKEVHQFHSLKHKLFKVSGLKIVPIMMHGIEKYTLAPFLFPLI